jgi:hypothetical protein
MSKFSGVQTVWGKCMVLYNSVIELYKCEKDQALALKKLFLELASKDQIIEMKTMLFYLKNATKFPLHKINLYGGNKESIWTIINSKKFLGSSKDFTEEFSCIVRSVSNIGRDSDEYFFSCSEHEIHTSCTSLTGEVL